VAGLRRLGRADDIARVLPSADFVPAPAQGALAIVGRTGDHDLARVAERLNHPATLSAVRAERAFAAELGGDCEVPLGCAARIRGRSLSVEGDVLSPDGRMRLRARRLGPSSAPERAGTELGRILLDRGAAELLGARR
jgi:hydroxymethylbilane synthase